jgi:hypothetical protein
MFSLLRQKHLKAPKDHIRLGVDWRLEPSCNFPVIVCGVLTCFLLPRRPVAAHSLDC